MRVERVQRRRNDSTVTVAEDKEALEPFRSPKGYSMRGKITTAWPSRTNRLSNEVSFPTFAVMSIVSPPKRHPLLAAYLVQLALHPLRTKALTTGTLTFLQEVLAAHLAGVPVRRPPRDASPVTHILARAHINARALKMGLYGLLVSAPLSHVLVGALQRAFAGRTSARARLGQLLASNLLIAPIQTVAYLASLALINGATSLDQVIATVKAGFFTVIKVWYPLARGMHSVSREFH